MDFKNNATPTYKNPMPMPEIKPARTIFTKADLRSGDVLERRNGDVEIVCLETGALTQVNGYNRLEELAKDFNGTDKLYDIMTIYRPQYAYQCQFNPKYYREGKLMYKRNEEIN